VRAGLSCRRSTLSHAGLSRGQWQLPASRIARDLAYDCKTAGVERNPRERDERMAEVKAVLKALSHQLGVYPYARSAFRAISPHHRSERKANQWLYRQLVSPGELCFDVGANVGQTTEALLGIGARVVAVEPNPKCLPVLEYEFKGRKGFTVVAKAVGSMPGVATLHTLDADSTASLRSDWPAGGYTQTVQVEVTTLDNLIAEFGRPHFLKVDIEGYELEAFQGLSQPVPLIYFEMVGREVGRAAEVLRLLGQIGCEGSVNATDGQNSEWLYSDWVDAGQFMRRVRQLPPARANVVVKSQLS
jgi:FkbM family methyltransferase